MFFLYKKEGANLIHATVKVNEKLYGLYKHSNKTISNVFLGICYISLISHITSIKFP